MSARLTVLPDERLLALSGTVEERLREAAARLDANNLGDFLDPLMRSALAEGFAKTGAHEGTVWLLDREREHLVAAFNTGSRAAEFVGVFKQPLRSGMISLVAASEQPLCENNVYTNAQQDKTLDTQLRLLTCAMLAVPFCFARQLRGVLSCVKIKPAGSGEPDPPGFAPRDLASLQSTASLVARLVEARLLSLVLGREDF